MHRTIHRWLHNAWQRCYSSSRYSNNASSSSGHTASSTASSNARTRFRRLKSAFYYYSDHLQRRPIIVNMLTSGAIFALGDITAQRYEAYLERQEHHDTSAHNEGIFGLTNTAHTHCQSEEMREGGKFQLNVKRLVACTAFGLVAMGPLGHLWYLYLDKFVSRRYPLSTHMKSHVATKVVLDTVVFNPLFLLIFFTSVSAVEGFGIHYMKQVSAMPPVC